MPGLCNLGVRMRKEGAVELGTAQQVVGGAALEGGEEHRPAACLGVAEAAG